MHKRSILTLVLIGIAASFLLSFMPKANDSALVKFVIGEVSVQTRGQTDWRSLKLNGEVKAGDRIRTALASRVELTMPDGTVLKINENTIFDVNEIKTPEKDNEDKFSFTLWAGNMWAKFKKVVSTRQKRLIESPSAVVAIRGTTLEIDVDFDQRTRVRVEEGRVVVTSKEADGEVSVGSNQETTVNKGQPPTPPTDYTPGSGQQGKDDEDELVFEIDMTSFVYTDPAVLSSGVPVSGRVTPGAIVTVNDRPIPVPPNGVLTGRLPVSEGVNNFRMVAQLGEISTVKNLGVLVNTSKPEVQLSSPLVSGYINRRDYSLSGAVFDQTPGDKVKVYINSEEVAEVQGRGSFNRTIILNEGQNTITVRAVDRSDNNREMSQSLFLDTVKPILTITEPADPVYIRFDPPPPPNATQTRIEQSIRGVVIDPEPSSGIKRMLVNGKEIQPNSDGTFDTILLLERGENRLNFYVEDLAGNIHRDNSRVIRVPQ
jgi:uncharacterized protein YfaP (DUF2135 family)